MLDTGNTRLAGEFGQAPYRGKPVTYSRDCLDVTGHAPHHRMNQAREGAIAGTRQYSDKRMNTSDYGDILASWVMARERLVVLRL
jgi:hypothetical protein